MTSHEDPLTMNALKKRRPLRPKTVSMPTSKITPQAKSSSSPQKLHLSQNLWKSNHHLLPDRSWEPNCLTPETRILKPSNLTLTKLSLKRLHSPTLLWTTINTYRRSKVNSIRLQKSNNLSQLSTWIRIDSCRSPTSVAS